MTSGRQLPWAAACFASALAGAGFVGCASAAPPAPPAVEPVSPQKGGVAAKEDTFNPCVGSKPVPHPFNGVLRNAKCEQDLFLTMASTATQLGVECRYCHVQLMVDGKEVPKKEDYPVMTERKKVANWMSQHLMESIKPANGEPMKCKLCHTDDEGKPVARIFGNPRDIKKAMVWMNVVMVNRFVGLDGEKLKCKSCHGANYGTPGFQSKIILTDHLPAHAAPKTTPPI